MWKPLLSLAAVLLLGSAGLSWVNSQTLKDIRDTLVVRTDEVNNRQKKKADTDDSLTKTTEETAQMVKDADDFASKAGDLDEQVATLEDSIDEKQQELADREDQLTELKGIIEDAEAAAQLRADYDSKEAEAASWKARVASLESQRRSVEAQIESHDAQIQVARDRLDDMKKGTVAPGFATRIRTAYPQWGFVVLSGGVAQGNLPKARLAVVRGGQQLALLKVTNAERSSAVAEIIPGTLAPGESLASGDLVVAAAVETTSEPDPEETAEPATASN